MTLCAARIITETWLVSDDVNHCRTF